MADGKTKKRKGLLRGHRTEVTFSLALGILVYFLLPSHISHASRVTLAWDVAALGLVILIFVLMARCDVATLRQRASQIDPSRIGYVVFVTAVAAVAIVNAFWVLRVGQTAPDDQLVFHLALGTATIFITWLTIQTVFAVHYAHLYYGDGEEDGEHAGGLIFPGHEAVHYFDFLYFAICTGMTFQVSDVSISRRRVRQWVTFHGVLSFVYNTVVVALLVDIAANLI